MNINLTYPNLTHLYVSQPNQPTIASNINDALNYTEK